VVYLKIDYLKGDIVDLIEEIANIGWLMYDKGWAEGTGGNFSVLLSKTSEKNGEFPTEVHKAYKMKMSFPKLNGRYFLVKGSRKRMREIKDNPEANLCIGFVHDNLFQTVWPLDAVNIPTSEITAHLAIQEYNLENRPESPVVLHAHPTELICISLNSFFTSSNRLTNNLNNLGPNLPVFLPEGIGYLKYYIPGSEEITTKTLELTKKYRLIVWELHGVICSGKTISECFDLIDIADKAAKIRRLTAEKAFGKKLDKKQIKELVKTYSNKTDPE